MANWWAVPFVALTLGFPSGRLPSRVHRRLVAGFFFVAVVMQVVWLLFLPFLPGRENLLPIHPDAELADVIDTVQRCFSARWASRSRSSRCCDGGGRRRCCGG